MHAHRQDRRPVLVLVALLLLLGVVGESEAAPADARVVSSTSGRTAPEVTGPPRAADWLFSVGAGISAGGDVFRARSDATEIWTAPVGGGTFSARRFTVTLDENVQLSAGLARRVTARGWLHLDFTWAEMDGTALALSGQVVDLVPYETFTFTRIGLAWEERLLDTPLAPFVTAGLGWLDVSAKSDALSQSTLVPVVGVGAVWRLQGAWAVRAELTDTIVQLESGGLVADDWPGAATHTELGPQHLIGIEAGMVIAF